MRQRHNIAKPATLGMLALSLALAGTAAPVLAEHELRPVERTATSEVRQGVQKILNSRLRTNVFDWVEAEVDGDRVTLHGAVYFPATADRIERQILRLPGVSEVVQEVDTLPVSAFDNRLRRQAYRLIYGNVTFSQYPALGRAPIHILVDQGRVTLVGKVNSKVEARLAEARIRAATLAFDVDNQLLVGSDMVPAGDIL